MKHSQGVLKTMFLTKRRALIVVALIMLGGRMAPSSHQALALAELGGTDQPEQPAVAPAGNAAPIVVEGEGSRPGHPTTRKHDCAIVETEVSDETSRFGLNGAWGGRDFCEPAA
jgi:hypothetical protein